MHTTLVVSEVSLAQRRQAGEVEHTVEVEDSPEVDVRLDGNAGGDASHLFVNAPESICDDLWASWPSIQESGLANKNVIVYKPLASVGNDFLRLQTLISVSVRVRGVLCTSYILWPHAGPFYQYNLFVNISNHVFFDCEYDVDCVSGRHRWAALVARPLSSVLSCALRSHGILLYVPPEHSCLRSNIVA